MTAFEELGVLPEIGRAVEEMEWTLPTDIQAEAIPLILGGGDVLIAAETGSGKTGAFCLPVIQVTWESIKKLKENKSGASSVKPEDKSFAMSVHDRTHELTISTDGLSCQSRHPKEWHGCRANKGIIGKGRIYYEAMADDGLCRVGFSTMEASLDLGTCNKSFGYGGTGKKSNNRQFDDYGGSFGRGDVIGCYLDLDNMEIAYTKNGQDLGLAFTLGNQFKNKPFFPAVVLKNAQMTFNFGETPFRYKPEPGFVGLASASENILVTNEKIGNSVAIRKIVPNAPQTIIIEPSLELAAQTCKQIELFKKHLGQPVVRELLVVGGSRIQDQISSLKSGIDIVVATPGRLEDLISTGNLSLQQCRFFILDEADALIKSGYEKMINRIYEKIPKMASDGSRLQMIVCSATLHDFSVKNMANRLMHFPIWVDLKGQDSVPDTVHHVVVPIDPRIDENWKQWKNDVFTDQVHFRDTVGVRTEEGLSEITKILKPAYCLKAIKEHKMDRGIIFCRTKLDCDNLEKYLNNSGEKNVSCFCLHGDRKPQERNNNLQKFKENKVNFLICTDVAARGIDIKGLPFMINMSLPEDKSNYVHRIGRVGRSERMGLAISLVSSVKEKVWYHGENCATRGRGCNNTRILTQGGCCTWNDEQQFLSDIEEHLGVTISQITTDMKVTADEFDGKVVYGKKKEDKGTGYIGHASEMEDALSQLVKWEKTAQLEYLKNFY